MKQINRLATAWCLLATLAGATAFAASGPDTTPDGLVRQKPRNVEEFYLRPGVDFTRYRRVLLDPVEVRFAQGWEQSHPEVSRAEAEQIRGEMVALARDEFTRQLQRRGKGSDTGYPVVEAPAADVLRVKASIVDLAISAPDVVGNSMRRMYVLSAGRGRLLAELHDSQSGELLARVVDSREARDYADFQIANRVTNSAEARKIVGLWSRLLRRYLDTAREPQKATATP